MARYVINQVCCDVPFHEGCRTESVMDCGNLPYITAMGDLVKKAKKQGWYIENRKYGVVLCPTCRKERGL